MEYIFPIICLQAGLLYKWLTHQHSHKINQTSTPKKRTKMILFRRGITRNGCQNAGKRSLLHSVQYHHKAVKYNTHELSMSVKPRKSSFDRLIAMIVQNTENEQTVNLLDEMLSSYEYANPSKQTQLINTVYYYGIDSGNVHILEYILNHVHKYNRNVSMEDLEMAVSGGGEKRVQVAKLFMQKLCDMDPEGKINFRHLLTCIYNGDLEMTKFLIENYSQNQVYWHTVNANHKHRETSNTILHFAAMNFRADTLKYLLEEQQNFKIQVNVRNVASFTPLEALIHRVVLRRENRQSIKKEDMTEDEYKMALRSAKLLDKHGCVIADYAIIERAGEPFVELLKRQYELDQVNKFVY